MNFTIQDKFVWNAEMNTTLAAILATQQPVWAVKKALTTQLTLAIHFAKTINFTIYSSKSALIVRKNSLIAKLAIIINVWPV